MTLCAWCASQTSETPCFQRDPPPDKEEHRAHTCWQQFIPHHWQVSDLGSSTSQLLSSLAKTPFAKHWAPVPFETALPQRQLARTESSSRDKEGSYSITLLLATEPQACSHFCSPPPKQARCQRVRHIQRIEVFQYLITETADKLAGIQAGFQWKHSHYSFACVSMNFHKNQHL